ncbi:MAG: response regulator transcription factor [Flavobacteriales bacterium]|nr:response regulator transcription factor [Flavobacteriales bacterium]
MKETINILLVDDHSMFRSGIKLILAHQNEFWCNIDEAGDGVQALKMASNKLYDIILLDINLPKLDGVGVANRIDTSKNKIIALSLHTEKFIVQQMIGAGVSGYVPKNCDADELIKAIIAVYNNERYYSNNISKILLEKDFVNNKIPSDLDNNGLYYTSLSQREKEILTLIVQEYKNSEIAEKLKLSKRTIESHRSRIVKKLNVKNMAGMIKYAITNGLA